MKTHTTPGYYYKLVKRVEADVAVFDQSFFGINISATVNQDLDIKTQRSYSIRGISRYNTSGNTEPVISYGNLLMYGIPMELEPN